MSSPGGWRRSFRDILTGSWWMLPAPEKGCFGRIRRPAASGARRMWLCAQNDRRRYWIVPQGCCGPEAGLSILPVLSHRRKTRKRSAALRSAGENMRWSPLIENDSVCLTAVRDLICVCGLIGSGERGICGSAEEGGKPGAGVPQWQWQRRTQGTR